MSDSSKTNKKRSFIVVLIIIVALAAGAAGGYFARGYFTTENESVAEQTDKVDYAKLSADLRAKKADGQKTEIVASFEETYNKTVGALRNSDPASWTQEDIDKAHFVLLYADSVDDFSQIETTYYQVMAAERAEKDINNNSAKVTQEERAAIIGRASLSN